MRVAIYCDRIRVIAVRITPKAWRPAGRGGPSVDCCFWNCTDTVTTYYIYSNGRVIAEYDEDGDLVWNYVYGLGQRVARYNGDNKQIYHNDHLGNMRAITDTLGAAALATADYYPFGEMLSVTGAPGRFTYNGNELDDEYGFDLYYYGARYMDPSSGRFITPDPVRDFYNPYSYVHNNPMNRIDPTGMWSANIQKYISCTGAVVQTDPSAWLVGGLAAVNSSTIEALKKLKELLVDAKEEADRMGDENSVLDNKNDWSELAAFMGDMINEITGFLDEKKSLGTYVRLGPNAPTPLSAGERYVVLNAGEFNKYMESTPMTNEYAIAYVTHEVAHAYDDGKHPGRKKGTSEPFAARMTFDMFYRVGASKKVYKASNNFDYGKVYLAEYLLRKYTTRAYDANERNGKTWNNAAYNKYRNSYIFDQTGVKEWIKKLDERP